MRPVRPPCSSTYGRAGRAAASWRSARRAAGRARLGPLGPGGGLVGPLRGVAAAAARPALRQPRSASARAFSSAESRSYCALYSATWVLRSACWAATWSTRDCASVVAFVAAASGGVGLLGRVLRGGEHLVVVVGDRAEGADPVEHLVGGRAAQHRLQGAQLVAGVGAARHLADLVAGGDDGGLGDLDLLAGLVGLRLLGGQRLTGVVELLGDDLEVVTPGRDEGRGLLGGRWAAPERRTPAAEREHDHAGGDQGEEDPPAGAATTGRAVRTRHVRRVCPFFHLPPTELADGFGREDTRHAGPVTGRRGASPQCCGGSPVHWPAGVLRAVWFGGGPVGRHPGG